MRTIGLDIHRDFCEVAIIEGGVVRSAPRVATTPETLTLFAQSLGPDDKVALENTGNARAIAELLRPYVARVVVADPLKVHLISLLDAEVARIDRVLAEEALGDAGTRRLMTIPGIDVITASTLRSAIGDVGRFPTPRHLVSYLGLNPTVSHL